MPHEDKPIVRFVSCLQKEKKIMTGVPAQKENQDRSTFGGIVHHLAGKVEKTSAVIGGGAIVIGCVSCVLALVSYSFFGGIFGWEEAVSILGPEPIGFIGGSIATALAATGIGRTAKSIHDKTKGYADNTGMILKNQVALVGSSLAVVASLGAGIKGGQILSEIIQIEDEKAAAVHAVSFSSDRVRRESGKLGEVFQTADGRSHVMLPQRAVNVHTAGQSFDVLCA